ncbi:uncharacterized protein LACBIDRAFT_321427 [Laccaria bicolor S238N-H82]|uniref:Predicted protein n=1 Tax=Laccaria bicolor (strain S238N-H82 / ATCC MYA-4686) TaxID=486041 RepID=B0CQC0_LACBS|nr:uncharacterized protein LACBIDRAFT_321427 [Laccaria bicolor S238N-H82]EDR16179.1 predicted protein [Laccaria bicolor S238N-H82]|eukprot:XP_001874387.1 predicted protein [Laccaria bicolor S238N-H82]
MSSSPSKVLLVQCLEALQPKLGTADVVTQSTGLAGHSVGTSENASVMVHRMLNFEYYQCFLSIPTSKFNRTLLIHSLFMSDNAPLDNVFTIKHDTKCARGPSLHYHSSFEEMKGEFSPSRGFEKSLPILNEKNFGPNRWFGTELRQHYVDRGWSEAPAACGGVMWSNRPAAHATTPSEARVGVVLLSGASKDLTDAVQREGKHCLGIGENYQGGAGWVPGFKSRTGRRNYLGKIQRSEHWQDSGLFAQPNNRSGSGELEGLALLFLNFNLVSTPTFKLQMQSARRVIYSLAQ